MCDNINNQNYYWNY